MSRSIAHIASVFALAVAAALFATTALADNGNGKDNGNSANAPGQVKQAGEPAQQQAAQPQPQAAQPQPQAAQPVAQSDTAPGIKPSNTTDKNTKCTTGGGTGASATCTSSNPKTTKVDASKRYGNGTTAAQIANSRGAPAGTVISGPGNSQPHKVAVCPGKTNKSGGRDVHAVKSYSTASCAPQTTSSSSAAVSSSASTQSSSSASESSSSASVTQSATQSTQTPAAMAQTSAAPAQSAAPATSPGAESGVLGTVKALTPSSPKHANAGVLGTVASISGGNLPFSGFPLWIAALAAFALIASGALLRRRSA
ncbi:MAG TPA: hypothetical protein VKP14_05815 [Gaiellaceae bacterium]|nr:hypothetical protein [Gaiellaceae bacterium]